MKLLGRKYTPAELLDINARAGWLAPDIQIITAIQLAESQGFAGAIGDETLAGAKTSDGRTWGNSIGLGQVRSIVEDRGKRTDRDAVMLTDPAFNSRASLNIKQQRGSFNDWSTYKNGDYKHYLSAVYMAANGKLSPGDVVTSPDTVTATGGTDTRFTEQFADYADPIAQLTMENAPDNFREVITSASISMSTSAISEIQISFRDPGLATASKLQIGTSRVQFGSWEFRVAALATGPGVKGDGATVVTARSAVAQNLRHPPYDQPMTFVGSPSQALATVVTGLLAEPSPARDQVTVDGPDTGPDGETAKTKGETWWSAAQRWADEEGFWLFDADNNLYFGRPTYLAGVLPMLSIEWTGKADDQILAMPEMRSTEDDAKSPNAASIVTTVTLRLHASLGFKLRPGMTVLVPGFGTLSDRFIITSVTGDLRAVSPVSVTAITIQDPDKTAIKDPLGDTTDSADVNGFSPATPTTPATGGGSSAGKGAAGSWDADAKDDTDTTLPKAATNAKQNAKNAYDFMKKKYGVGLKPPNVNGFNVVSAGHHATNPNSHHETGLAFDWLATGDANVAYAMKLPGVTYVIHDSKIYNRSDGFKPRYYGGTYKSGKKKDPHEHHIHIDFG